MSDVCGRSPVRFRRQAPRTSRMSMEDASLPREVETEYEAEAHEMVLRSWSSSSYWHARRARGSRRGCGRYRSTVRRGPKGARSHDHQIRSPLQGPRPTQWCPRPGTRAVVSRVGSSAAIIVRFGPRASRCRSKAAPPGLDDSLRRLKATVTRNRPAGTPPASAWPLC